MCKPKVVQMLDERLISYRLLTLPSNAHTVSDVVKLAGVDVHEICKTILLIDKTTKEPFLVVVPGDRRINMLKLQNLTGMIFRFAQSDEVKDITGYDVGALPPYGHKRKITTYVDAELMQNKKINFGTGVHNLGIEIKTSDLSRLADFEVINITE